jgi:hypothetical protein
VGKDRRRRCIGPQVAVSARSNLMGELDRVQRHADDLQRHVDRLRRRRIDRAVRAPCLDIRHVRVGVAVDQFLAARTQFSRSFDGRLRPRPCLRGEPGGLLEQRRGKRDGGGRGRASGRRRL